MEKEISGSQFDLSLRLDEIFFRRVVSHRHEEQPVHHFVGAAGPGCIQEPNKGPGWPLGQPQCHQAQGHPAACNTYSEAWPQFFVFAPVLPKFMKVPWDGAADGHGLVWDPELCPWFCGDGLAPVAQSWYLTPCVTLALGQSWYLTPVHWDSPDTSLCHLCTPSPLSCPHTWPCCPCSAGEYRSLEVTFLSLDNHSYCHLPLCWDSKGNVFKKCGLLLPRVFPLLKSVPRTLVCS